MPKNSAISSAIFGIYRLLIIFSFIFTFYFAQSIIVPIIIAVLLTFLLSPLVTWLEKWLGRVISILLVVIVVFSSIGFTGYVVAKQLMVTTASSQSYYDAFQSKIQAFQLPKTEFFNQIERFVTGLIGESLPESSGSESQESLAQVKLIDLSGNITGLLEGFFGSFFKFLMMAAITLILVLFMLFHKEDIRSRIVKVIGQSRISSTTSAMNDASERVHQYLYRLFIVNLVYGICVSIGLYFIGIPNAILWGCFAGILRFIPYIGSWIGALIPIALSLIVTNTWMTPLMTVSLFIILEIITVNFVEPFYFGIGTGVSSFALILAALFWTWLWGPIGLLLSTPLTVCLVVLGTYVTNMSFFSILLSQEPALTPAEEYYHRLLSRRSSSSMDVVEAYLQKNSVLSLDDTILLPVISQTEWDFRQDLIDNEQRDNVYQGIRDIIEFVNQNDQKETKDEEKKEILGKVLCVSARTKADEIGVDILAQLLTSESFEVHKSEKQTINEITSLVDQENPDIVCIGVMAPFDVYQARTICAKIHRRKPQLPIVICLFGIASVDGQILERLISAGASKVVLSFAQAVSAIHELKS